MLTYKIVLYYLPLISLIIIKRTLRLGLIITIHLLFYFKFNIKMFFLPIPIKGNSGEPVSIQKRQHHSSNCEVDYEYTILKYEHQVNEHQVNENQVNEHQVNEHQVEPYTVITNTEQTKVFAYMAPRETTSFTDLKMEDYQEGDVVEVKESIEGTMITFFWNDEIGEWNICTRNGVGGDYSFMRPTNKGDESPSTFREMVVDTFRIALMVHRIARPEDVHDLNDVPLLASLSKTHCYTCILQHPANHIVYRFAPFCSFLKLVAIYETDAMPPLVPHDSDLRYRSCVRELANPDYPEIAKSYLEDSREDGDDEIWKMGYRVFGHPGTTSEFVQTFDDLLNVKKEVFETYVENMIIVNNSKVYSGDIGEHPDSLYYPPAWILTNNRTGQRCEIKNPFYELAKSLRNMHPNMRYQYLDLRRRQLVDDYLLAFPRYKTEIAYLEKEYEQFVTEVHSAYVKFYIKKERDGKIPKQYFVHAAGIHHNIYLTQSGIRQKITRETVQSYFDMFPTAKMFYFLTRTEPEPKDQEEEETVEEVSSA